MTKEEGYYYHLKRGDYFSRIIFLDYVSTWKLKKRIAYSRLLVIEFSDLDPAATLLIRARIQSATSFANVILSCPGSACTM